MRFDSVAGHQFNKKQKKYKRMNEAQVKNIIVLVFSIFGGILTARGIATTDQLSQTSSLLQSIVGPIMTLVAVVYGIFNHTETQQISTTSTLKSVRRVVTDSAVALKISKPKVIHELAPTSANNLGSQSF